METEIAIDETSQIAALFAMTNRLAHEKGILLNCMNIIMRYVDAGKYDLIKPEMLKALIKMGYE